ncbi:hypothetical protein DAKH74_046910 [Maudiozyma humilis]|uniref:Uncharacterized protein n=1 Tax=Maudiozyma humilis TaxID=51915 RepID=A0AAV5S2J3_MAUHU|nr:hypothetical protein DAKH74_046910 [Kazachstania humilis]
MRPYAVFLFFLASLSTCIAAAEQSKYSVNFFSVMANITYEIENNDKGKDFSRTLTKMNKLAVDVDAKYQKKPFAQYLLTKVFELKLDQIQTEKSIKTKVHLKNIVDGLARALERSPSDFNFKSLSYIKKLSQEQFASLVSKASAVNAEAAAESEDAAGIFKRATRYPLFQRTVGHLAIIFTIGSTLMDTCGMVPEVVCSLLFAVSMVGVAFWFVDIARLALGIGSLSISDIL